MSRRKAAIVILVVAVAAVVAILGPGLSSLNAAPQGEDPVLEEFVPSEELPADSAVAFPVDI